MMTRENIELAPNPCPGKASNQHISFIYITVEHETLAQTVVGWLNATKNADATTTKSL